ncbi:MAG: L-2-amino-thiazoline-4-carboxylic acid hydrolase [Methanomassiliicoccales archaeon]|nr:L-2-amino-thiazoline-4-carboxylic acid hydrolase [Methanomassiliicoccales archaeon]
MEQLKEITMSRDEKDAMLSEAMSQWWLGAIGTMMKTMGPEETMKAYGPTMRQIGRDWATRFVKEKGYKGNDAIATASVIRMWEKMMGIEGKVLEASPNRVVVKNTKCPLSGAMPQACSSLECAIWGHLDVISPGYRFVSKHHMTKGDPYCEWVIEKK